MESRVQKKREAEEKNKARKSWKQHRWSWQGKSILPEEDLKEFLHELDTPVEEANHHAVVIQAAFRGYQARKKVKDMKKSVVAEEEAKRKSQFGEGDQKRVTVQEEEDEGEEMAKPRKTWHQHRTSKDGTSILKPEELDEFLHELEEHGVTREKVEEKAVILQSAFRGYQARKKVKEIRKSLVQTEDVLQKSMVQETVAEPDSIVSEGRTTTVPEESILPTTASETVQDSPTTATATAEEQSPPQEGKQEGDSGASPDEAPQQTTAENPA